MQYVSRVLSGIGRALQIAIYAVLRVIHAVIASICRLLGVQPPAPPRIPNPDVQRDQVQSYLGRELERSLSEEPVHEIGRIVFEFARERDPEKRWSMNLDALSPSQRRWLMVQPESELQRLAAAGPVACQAAISEVKGRVRRVEMRGRSLRPIRQSVRRDEREDGDYVLTPKMV